MRREQFDDQMLYCRFCLMPILGASHKAVFGYDLIWELSVQNVDQPWPIRQ